MNVFLYVALATIAGCTLSYALGRGRNEFTIIPAAFAILLLSIILGVFLSFGLLSGVSRFCSLIGINAIACIQTDDQTVWYLALPMFAFPLYMIFMFTSRSKSMAS